MRWVYSLVHFTSGSGYHDVRGLATLEIKWHFAMLLLTLVTSSGCFALS
jgi:hypothetical protein